MSKRIPLLKHKIKQNRSDIFSYLPKASSFNATIYKIFQHKTYKLNWNGFNMKSIGIWVLFMINLILRSAKKAGLRFLQESEIVPKIMS